jgi:glyceraldehyde-3-phosphate dehydrogenase (NADP+)
MVLAATKPHPIYLAGDWVESSDVLEVTNPADAERSPGATYSATAEQYESAVQAAVDAFDVTRKLPAYERGRALREISAGLTARREEIGALMTAEIGKLTADSILEVDRTALTFRLAAEEAERMTGEVIPLDLIASSKGRIGITRRFPIGPVAGISPFNLPLGLSAHKLAPAIATGCPIVLKPPSAAPLSVLAMTEVIDAAGLPRGALSVLPMSRELGDRLVEDERFKLLSFTGSPSVGWRMKERAGKKKVVLELGGNAAVIVDDSANLEWAVKRCIAGGYKYGGQLCISVQRLFVHETVRDEFVERFRAGVEKLRVGDPSQPGVDVGPMIDRGAVERTQRWVDEAVALGGQVVVGGTSDGPFFSPTILDAVPTGAQICSNEAFAPVVILFTFRDFDDALRQVNDSSFGLQAGVFTNDLAHSWAAFNELEVGGVIINDIPTYRIDHMPYGGVKDSGLGREGIRYAMEDMTELRLMVVAPTD